MFDFENANEEQRQVILATEGPVLTIAGPGTGKTFTLVKRIVYLVLEKKVKPSEILVVTFTDKAAKELLTRISNEFIKYDLNINVNELYVGTFHSICLRLLKENTDLSQHSKKSRVLDAFEQAYLVCKNIENFNSLKGFKEHIPLSLGAWKQSLEICRYANQMMEELVNVDIIENDSDEDVRFLVRLVKRYLDLLERNNAMDFSSIQTETYSMLRSCPEALGRIQNKIRYIMVDEYQDTNYIQEQLILLLAGDNMNICVVGDDDQGMYRFRGATIRNILEFPYKVKKNKCTVIQLNKNYRSEPGIISFYNSWMQDVDEINLFNWDKYRYNKKIVATKSNIHNAASVYKCGGDSVDIEKEDLLQLIRKLKDCGNITDYNQVAFLFRSVKSEEAVTIGKYLEENGIPVYSPRSDMFFERQEVKQLFGCLIACFSSYMQDLKKNIFLHKISDNLRQYYIDCVKQALALMKSDIELHHFIDSQMRIIHGLTEESGIGLLDIFYKLISFEPFKSYLHADLKNNVLNTRAARNLSEISRMLSKFSFLHEMHQITPENKIAIPEELFNLYLKYMYIDGISEYEDESEYAPSGCISFMTIHQSKGLEFPVVVVGSLGNAPRRNRDPLMLMAETRLFNRTPFEPISDIKYFDFWRLYYVAFSRAQNLLVLANKKDDSKYFGTYLDTLPHVDDFSSKDIFAPVKSVNYKHVYSFTSHVSVYDGCPAQYKYFKEYSFAQNQMFHTSVGSLVHATLEDLNKCIITDQTEKVTEEKIREWFTINYQDIQKQTGYQLTDVQRENALMQVIWYYRHRKDELGKVWKAEEEINLVLPECILQGIVDLIEGVGDTVEIVDYKTGPKPDIVNHPEQIDHYKKQLELYAYLVEKRYGKKVSRMNLYYTSVLEGNPIITFEWNQNSVNSTIEEIINTIHCIQSKDFNHSVQNSYACKFCDMKYVCGKAEI